ncbi:hypothetical protein REPUB_Repub11eG0140400 [Reevesia pubescens]
MDLILSVDSTLHPHGCLIEDIRALVKKDWSVSFSHVFREGNFCADVLAKAGCSLDVDIELLRSPPVSVLQHLHADKWGIKFPRGFKLS